MAIRGMTYYQLMSLQSNLVLKVVGCGRARHVEFILIGRGCGSVMGFVSVELEGVIVKGLGLDKKLGLSGDIGWVVSEVCGAVVGTEIG